MKYLKVRIRETKRIRIEKSGVALVEANTSFHDEKQGGGRKEGEDIVLINIENGEVEILDLPPNLSLRDILRKNNKVVVFPYCNNGNQQKEEKEEFLPCVLFVAETMEECLKHYSLFLKEIINPSRVTVLPTAKSRIGLILDNKNAFVISKIESGGRVENIFGNDEESDDDED